MLRAALLRRAVEDIQRLIQVKSAKQACGALLQRGSVGDDLWQRFERAEKEMEEELRDVVTEVSCMLSFKVDGPASLCLPASLIYFYFSLFVFCYAFVGLWEEKIPISEEVERRTRRLTLFVHLPNSPRREI